MSGLREKLAEIIDGWGNISADRRIKLASEILSHLKSQIEQMENPYGFARGIEAYEQCRQDILSRLQ